MRGTVTSVGLNLRARAHAAAHIIDQIAKGDKVEILDAMPGGWLKVEVVRTGERGYVFAKFVKADPVAPVAPPDVEPVPAPHEDEPTDPRVWIVSAIGLVAGVLAMLWAFG
jgi:23S rRNA U2552 (ribose-2'-O)-methylase RlmE/FtsJ